MKSEYAANLAMANSAEQRCRATVKAARKARAIPVGHAQPILFTRWLYYLLRGDLA